MDKDKTIRKMEKALRLISDWRTIAHNHDDDMGIERRDFGEDDIETIEQYASEVLEDAFPSVNDKD